MWYVYLLLCDNKYFYIGITPDLVRRVIQHKSKESTATKRYSEINLVYVEKYDTKYQAAEREKQLKGWSHKKKQMLVDGILGKNVYTEIVEVVGKLELI